jgi:hypothetical protein
LLRTPYLQVINKEVLESYIKSHGFREYNKNPKAAPHPLSQIPMTTLAVIVTMVTFVYNGFRNRKAKTVILRPTVTPIEYQQEIIIGNQGKQ